MAETGDKVTRRYSNFRGVDLRGEECDSNRSPDSLNMWRNYNRLACIETRPGLHKMCGHTSWIRSMMWHKGLLYFIDNAGDLNALLSDGTVNTHDSNIGDGGILFEFGGKAYAKGSNLFYCITEGTKINPTIPTTTIGRKPAGGGTPHQEVNMLSDFRKNSFLCDGESTVFYLDTEDIDDDYKPVVEMGTKNLLYNLEYGDVDIAISDPNAEFNTSYGFKTVKAKSWMNKDLSSDVRPGYFFFGAETSPYKTTVTYQIKIPEDQVVHISDFKNNPNNEYITFKWFVDGASVSRKGTEVAKDGLTLQRTNTLWVEIGTVKKNISSYQNEFKLEILDALNSTDADDYYDVDCENGKISFLYAPPPPLTDGQDNLVVTFKKSNEENRSKIMGCTLAQEFDNRMFFSGNPEYPNTIWHSALNDVTYFSDLDYYIDGVDSAPIRSMVTGNNGLWVFRDTQNANNGVFYHTPALDDQYGKVYPSSHSSISLGCSGKAINFNDDIVFFSPKGMEGITTDINTEQFATHRSSLVDRLMVVDNTAYKSMQLAEWRGYLLVFIGTEVYLADSRAVLNNENHIEYEWFRWNLGHRVTCSTVHNEDLYIATEGEGDDDGCIFSLTKDAKDGDDYYALGETTEIKSYWTTPKDYFGSANKLKTTNKKGCITEAFGDVTVYVRTDDDDSFEEIGINENVDDYFVSRIKRKKFKDIQLKFESTTGFRLESATLEAFIGGYIKR